MTGVRVVLITAPETAAERIARNLLDGRLAACVNMVPGIRSLYHWKGKVCDDVETLLIAKTTADQVENLIQRVREIHPYSVPEVLVLPVESGAAAYLAWVASETLDQG